MYITRNDSIKFFIYTVLFFFLFFGYNRVSGPYFETTYDSASIDNQEIAAPEIIRAIDTDAPTQHIVRKNIQKTMIKKDPLTIVFNPENITLDDGLLDRLKEVVHSSHFQSKVTPLYLTLDAEQDEPRGQVMGHKLILSTKIINDSEQLKVFMHELGHIIDIFYLKKSLLADPSDAFYDISWDSFNTKKKGQKIANFVSGSGLSNKYEDFAESFSFYIFHNEDFLSRAKSNPILQQKYDFFRSTVFETDAFIGTSFETDIISSYNWDTTKIPVDMKKYLYYIK